MPTDGAYWLLVAEQPRTGERKYLISNAPASTDPAGLLREALERWRIEQWFQRSKQDTGLGDFEVRTYRSLMRHWLLVRLAMLFLSTQTVRLRAKKKAITFEQVARVAQALSWPIWPWRWSYRQLLDEAAYHQVRNAISYRSRRRHAAVDSS